MLRWAVNVAAWNPTDKQWQLVLSCLPQEAQDRCLKYRQKNDQKRAIVSQVLQRACVSRLLGEQWQAVDLQRTKGSKPFYAGSRSRNDAPNFNFNVSHEGDYVVLACEGYCLCGVDVAAPHQLRYGTKPLRQTLALMEPQLVESEWQLIQSLAPDESAMEAAFQAIWSCKEAFIKARGDGVAFELGRLEVRLPQATSADWMRQPVQAATLAVDGQVQHNWRAFLQQLPNRHWAAVVRGPPTAAVDAHGVFTAAFRQPNIPEAQLQQYLDALSPMFDLLDVEDVLPDEVLGRYQLAADDRSCSTGVVRDAL